MLHCAAYSARHRLVAVDAVHLSQRLPAHGAHWERTNAAVAVQTFCAEAKAAKLNDSRLFFDTAHANANAKGKTKGDVEERVEGRTEFNCGMHSFRWKRLREFR